MSEQPQDRPEDPDQPPAPTDAPVAGGTDESPPAQGEGAPDSW